MTFCHLVLARPAGLLLPVFRLQTNLGKLQLEMPGNSGGPYKTKKEAKKWLKQVEIFKHRKS